MQEQDWSEINDDTFVACHRMLDDMQTELKKYSGKEAFEYLKPLSYMIVEATRDLFHHRNERIEAADFILDSIH